MTDRKTIPVAAPLFTGNEKRYILECLESGWISSIGPFIQKFEDKFAEYCGVRYAVACNNGTSALHAALAALDVGAGDEVIVPTLTYVSTANAVRYCGARPVLIDSEPRTLNLDPEKLEAAITSRTKGIIAVHLYGHPADMDPILAVARKHRLFVLEDAAEAHGAVYNGNKVGGLGDVATFSFYGNKIITTGEGGMITTSRADLNEKLRILRGQGMDPARRYWFPQIGYNYRMTNVAAAIGLAQLEQIDEFLEKRSQVAGWYRTHLSDLTTVLTLPVEEKWATCAFWSYTVLLRKSVLLERDALLALLADDGIDTRPVFYPMHVLPPYLESAAAYPVADGLAQRGLSLPMHVGLTEDDVIYIAARLAHWLCD